MVNVFPIDLEYLQFVNLNNPEQKRLVDATIDAQLEPLKTWSFEDRKNTLVLGTIVWEVNNFPGSPMKQNFQYFENKCRDLGSKVHLITRIDLQNNVVGIDNCTCIDFCIVRALYDTDRLGQTLNTEWHSENKKFLFLMGKALKPHRIGLLYRLYKQKLLNSDRSIWSFFGGISADDCQGLVPRDATVDELVTLINNYQQNPDQINRVNNNYPGYPFDSGMYKNTNLSVVSETHYHGNPWNSEKMYRPILNHHPFLIAGAVNHTQYLKDMGFETFDQYFVVPAYSAVADLDSRLDAIVENIKLFDPSAEQIEQIHRATQKNFQRLHELANHYIDVLDCMLLGYGISKHWTEILPLEQSAYVSWQYYYQQIKGSNWPSCYTIADCVNLPTEIQEELRTKFEVNF
jgi:hypothetical protein